MEYRDIFSVFPTFACLWLGMFVGWALSLLWVYQDAQARGKTGCLWVLIVTFTWPIGLLVYFVLRDRTVQL